MAQLTTAQAAARLGVKVETVYTYASKGLLRAHRQPGTHRSFFDSGEVEALARRGRPRRASSAALIDSQLSTFGPGEVLYRGRDAASLATTKAFEQVARWLWTGEDLGFDQPWQSDSVLLTGTQDPRHRLQAAVILASANNAQRGDLSPRSIVAIGQSLITTMVRSLPLQSGTEAPRLELNPDEPPLPDTISGQLWVRLTAKRAASPLVTALNAALVLVADHELVPSTLSARMAASVRADPYAVVSAALATLTGERHGRTNRFAYELLRSAKTMGPAAALEHSQQIYGRYPGFGHYFFREGDPRASLLIELVRKAMPRSSVIRLVDSVVSTARRRTRLQPNMDLALATLTLATRMAPYAGEAILIVGRTAGWLAHALEEYNEQPVRFRSRSTRTL